MTLTVFGEVPAGKALRRDVAQAGDDVWVSGSLGGAALALRQLHGSVALKTEILTLALARLHTPIPRNALGCALVGLAHSAIDISDGLIADLTHICERSGLSAMVDWAAVPLFPALLSVGSALQIRCALAGGDDYELCFTASENDRAAIEVIASTTGIMLTRIGKVLAGKPNVTVCDERGAPMNIPVSGFDHFAAERT
jgi:thiamine-monophosphate kinase